MVVLAMAALVTCAPTEPEPDPVVPCHTVIVSEFGDTIHLGTVLAPDIHLDFVVESWTEGECGS